MIGDMIAFCNDNTVLIESMVAVASLIVCIH